MNILLGATLGGLGFWLFFHQIWNLRRALAEGIIHIRNYAWDYRRDEDPFWFWATTVFSVIFLLFGLLIGVGGIWLILFEIFQV